MSPIIDEADLRDFRIGVRKLSYDPADFLVSSGAKPGAHLGNGQHAVCEFVWVARLTLYSKCEYEGGHARTWAATALEDATAGRFGPPHPAKD